MTSLAGEEREQAYGEHYSFGSLNILSRLVPLNADITL